MLAVQTIVNTICQPVPHRQIVFTIPERLRIYCRCDRGLLGQLAQAAWSTVAEVYRDVLQRQDITPGVIAGIQTFGELIHVHPHVHAIATDGAFTPDGTFICLPKIDTQRLLSTWQTKVFELFLAAEKIDQATVDQMRSWPHSGFSVDNSVYVPPHDTAALERLAQYILCRPFSRAVHGEPPTQQASWNWYRTPSFSSSRRSRVRPPSRPTCNWCSTQNSYSRTVAGVIGGQTTLGQRA